MDTAATPELAEKLAKIVALLRHGKVQEADDLATETLAAQQVADAAARGEKTPPPAPRPTQVVWLDFAHRMSSLLGHPPVLEELLQELTAPDAPKAE